MKKYLFVIFSVVGSPVFAQSAAHEFSFSAGGGLSHLNYGATSSPGTGGLAGSGYRYYLSGQWSLGTGAELLLYHSRADLEVARGSSDARDAEGSSFQFRYEAKNYRENQRAFYLAVPLNVQFETGGRGPAWYMNLGGKMAFHLNGHYQARVPGLVTTGYYPEWNVELAAPAFMGFSEWENINPGKSDFKTKTAFLLSAETGVKMNKRFYAGVYADYGLNNILQANDRSALISYITDEPTRFSYASVTAALDGKGVPLARKMNLFSAGIKLTLVLNR